LSKTSDRRDHLPELLARGPQNLEQQEGYVWTPIRARPRTEKILAGFCGRVDVDVYLPLVRRRRRYQRRTVVTFVPMFAGYVFARLPEGDASPLYDCNKIAWVLPVREQDEIALLDELRGIRIIELAELEKDIEVRPELKPGTPVVVAQGPFRGVCGIIERRHGRTRLTVNVDMLGQCVTVEVETTAIDIDS
jgi:transcription antitermination factor NusG